MRGPFNYDSAMGAVEDWDGTGKRRSGHADIVLFVLSAAAAVLVFLVFAPQIERINSESPVLLTVLFAPAMGIGLLYGMRMTELAVRPSETRGALRRSATKVFLFFFVIGGLFSSVNFALNGGSIMPELDILEDGLLVWAEAFVYANGGATFLILSSIALMASATKRIVGMSSGLLNRAVTCVSTFIFFSMLALGFTGSDPTHSAVFLYTFYHAGIIGGAFIAMNRLTRNLNTMEDYANGY